MEVFCGNCTAVPIESRYFCKNELGFSCIKMREIFNSRGLSKYVYEWKENREWQSHPWLCPISLGNSFFIFQTPSSIFIKLLVHSSQPCFVPKINITLMSWIFRICKMQMRFFCSEYIKKGCPIKRSSKLTTKNIGINFGGSLYYRKTKIYSRKIQVV